MDLLALILMAMAFVVSLRFPKWPPWLRTLWYPLITLAFICQFTTMADSFVNWGPDS